MKITISNEFFLDPKVAEIPTDQSSNSRLLTRKETATETVFEEKIPKQFENAEQLMALQDQVSNAKSIIAGQFGVTFVL